MYENEDSFIKITSENFDEYKDIDIAAFSIAAPGACGHHGRKTMVDVHSNVYHTELFDEHALTEDQFLALFPVFKDYKPERVPDKPWFKSPGWTELYMGLGNSLFVRDDYIERFASADRSTNKGELYTTWMETMMSILETEKQQTQNNMNEEEYYEEEQYERHYDDFGGYNGYDDETIYDAFEGDPEATWNVD